MGRTTNTCDRCFLPTPPFDMYSYWEINKQINDYVKVEVCYQCLKTKLLQRKLIRI